MEFIFDLLSDLIFVTGSDGVIVRCNQAVIDRLNTHYINVIGKPISEILAPGKRDGVEELNSYAKGFRGWCRLYDVSTIPIDVGGAERKIFYPA